MLTVTLIYVIYLYIYLSIDLFIYLFIYLFANNKGHKISSGSRAAWKEKQGAYFKIMYLFLDGLSTV